MNLKMVKFGVRSSSIYCRNESNKSFCMEMLEGLEVDVVRAVGFRSRRHKLVVYLEFWEVGGLKFECSMNCYFCSRLDSEFNIYVVER